MWSPDPRPVLTSPQRGCHPLTALSGSRLYVFHDSAVPKSVKPTQQIQEPVQVQIELSEGSRAESHVELPTEQLATGMRTRSGRSVRPPLRYRVV